MRNFLRYLPFVLFFLSNHLSATSVIPFKHLGEAAQSSEAVVLATVESDFTTTAGPLAFFDCRLRVEEAAKGALRPGEAFTLRQHSHRMGDYFVDIAGDFVPEVGSTYLLFLHRVGDAWRPITFSYYVFEKKIIGDQEFLAPLAEGLSIALVSRPDGVRPEPVGVYRAQELMHLLREYASGGALPWNASSALTGLSLSDFPQSRALPAGCDFILPGSGSLCRWQNQSVEVYYEQTDAPAGFNATLSTVLGTMVANYPGIDPSNAGQTSFSPNCADGTVTGADFVSFLNGLNGFQTTLIFLNDPCNQIANLNNCAGVLAIGGSYLSSATHQYKGDTWNNALLGFVVVNNGTFECLSAGDYELMLIHEMTHTYRMDHLNPAAYPNQNMNPACCNPIGVKDMECMNYVYEFAAPVTLTRFDVQPYQQRQVLVTWETANEKDNDYFMVERSADGKRFEMVQKVSGRQFSTDITRYEWLDLRPYPGLNYYRLSQVDFDGQTTNFGVKAVKVGEASGAFQLFPNPVSHSTLSLMADLSAPFNGFMDIIDQNGRVLGTQTLVWDKGRNRLEEPVEHLAPGIYWLRLREADQVQVLKFFKK
ncbi:MAG: T9SS type A sorting domain-containing protein [Saprospiraceae bacterium]|nr:T9SS type A sorting domain-containing protein [Saprospiraceae bacterium]